MSPKTSNPMEKSTCCCSFSFSPTALTAKSDSSMVWDSSLSKVIPSKRVLLIISMLTESLNSNLVDDLLVLIPPHGIDDAVGVAPIIEVAALEVAPHHGDPAVQQIPIVKDAETQGVGGGRGVGGELAQVAITAGGATVEGSPHAHTLGNLPSQLQAAVQEGFRNIVALALGDGLVVRQTGTAFHGEVENPARSCAERSGPGWPAGCPAGAMFSVPDRLVVRSSFQSRPTLMVAFRGNRVPLL